MEHAAAAGQTDSSLVDVRARRLTEIMTELVPRIRRVCPHLPDEVFHDLIQEMALLKLRDEETRW